MPHMPVGRPFGELDLDHHVGLDSALAPRLALRPPTRFHLVRLESWLVDFDFDSRL